MRMIAIYARQSVDKKDSLSIETQIEQCKKHLTDNEALEVKVYPDKGYSGKNTERPHLVEMFEEIKKNNIEKVLVYRLDRISRNILDFYNLYNIMQDNKTEFCSISENFDTTSPMGRAMMGIIVIFAQMEREAIQQRVKDNYYSRIAERGTWAGGVAPYGFVNAKNNEKQPTLIVNEKEIEAVKLIFSLYSQEANISLGKITKILESKGYKSRKRKTFDNVTIARILQNSVYVKADNLLYKYFKLKNINFLNEEKFWTGETSCHVVGKRVGNSNIRKYTDLKEQSVYLTNFQGIIDSKTYVIVQERLASNEQIGRANGKSNLQELAGKIKCKNCGYAIKMYSKNNLACYGRYGLRLCNVTINIKLGEIQKAVAIQIQEQLDKMSELKEEKNSQVKKYIEKKEDYEKQLSNLIEIAAKSEVLQQAVIKKIEYIQNEINELELKISMNKSSQLIFENNKIIYSNLNMEEKKLIVQQLIEKIYLDKNKNIEIVWKY